MIHKLKKKFILIMMAFVSCILITLFIILAIINLRQIQYDIRESLNWALEENVGQTSQVDMQAPWSKKEQENSMIRANSFTILTDAQFNYQTTLTTFYQISETQAQNIISAIQQQKKTKGVLWRLNVAYEYKQTDDGYTFGIVDITFQKNNILNFLLTSIFVGIISFTSFLVMSVLLSMWALKPVEQAWNQQKQFIADASHELKTPLTIILADSDILLNATSETQKQYKWITSIQSEAMRMKQLVEQLLFLAKHDTNKTTIEMEQCCLSEIVWSCVLPYESMAYEQQIQLESHIEDEIYVWGNQAQLKQLLLIFLDNALKYTPARNKIEISLEKKEANAMLSIKNTGSSITKEDLPHIFERFYRCDRSRIYQGGHGLGLSIAKQIANLHNIKMDVKSSEEEGTIFTLLLALQKKLHDPFS